MKSITIQLTILAYCLGAFALHVRSTPQTIADACPSAQEVSSSTITANGNEIVRQVFACPEGNFTMTAKAVQSNAPSTRSRSLVEARSQAECTTPSPECQCGASYECSCFEDSSGPSSSDCSTLIGSMAVISSIEGPTFIVQPGQVHAISLRTCTLGFVNLVSTPIEYCWDDLATAGQVVVGCMSDAPFANAVCTALDQRFVTRLGLSL